ncbi:MAG TPA: flagellar filament capping protein FliD, partial [Bryobacteraceae bacterium]|nr:flagellar filament capping protein FliD [Bryobacteraceae bacterium]
PVAVQLNDGSDDLLASASVGTLATYRVNDLPAGSPISSDTAVGIEIAPGLKVDLLDVGTSAITVAKDSNSLTGALSSFARAYSEVVAEIDKHRGDSGGALTGQSILGEVSQSLRRLFNYSGSGSIEGAASLGLTFSEDGVLSFNQSTLASLDQNEIDSFLGAIDQDGFLEAADHILDSLDSIGSGLLPTASDGLIRQLTAGEETIRKQEDRIELLQDRLSAQMAAADALIASLEQQVNYINGLFESMAGSKK